MVSPKGRPGSRRHRRREDRALPGAAQPSPQVVGAAFVLQYYHVLHKSPDLVHKFYLDSSIVSRPDSNGMMTTVTTMQAINDKLLSMDLSDCTAEIESVDSHASYKDGVLVVVTGSLTGRDNVRRKFTQTIFLAPQEIGGYVVLNDIFRFVDPSQPSEAGEVIVKGTNGYFSAAALTTPEPEPSLVQEPQMATSVEDETSHPVEDFDDGEEVIKPTEHEPPEASFVVAADPEVHVGQSDDQLVSEAAVSVSYEIHVGQSYDQLVSEATVPVSQEVHAGQSDDQLVSEAAISVSQEVHVGQSDDQPASEAAISVSQEDEPKKSYASIFLVAGVAAGLWAYQRHRRKTNVLIMALNLVRGVPLTKMEKKTILDILTPPPPQRKIWWWT